MIVGLIDSGLGLLPTAARLRTLRPELDLILLMDPDQAPWGPKPDAWVVERVLGATAQALDAGADVIVLPCNTASVTALADVRAHVGPGVPVVGTVPAIKPAAAETERIAIWATAATTASAYQARLVETFAAGRTVTPVACHGLADSIDRGDAVGISAAIRAAAGATPAGVESVVLGCTHYRLVVDEIVATLGPSALSKSRTVARQTVRRVDELDRPSTGSGSVTVSLSGRAGDMPASALAHSEGRLLAGSEQPARR